MGLWNFVKGALNERAENIREYIERYSQMDDETLLQIYRKSNLSANQRFAIARVLRERGYGADDN